LVYPGIATIWNLLSTKKKRIFTISCAKGKFCINLIKKDEKIVMNCKETGSNKSIYHTFDNKFMAAIYIHLILCKQDENIYINLHDNYTS
jgi:hypothetical protein